MSASILAAETAREQRIHDSVVDGYDDTRYDAAALIGYHVLPRLVLSAGWFVTHTAASVNSQTTSMPVDANGWLNGPTATLDYRGADTVDYYDEGFAARAQYRQARHELGAERDVLDLTARAQFSHAFLADQATTLIAQANLIESPSLVDVRLLGSAVGTRGFELQTLWATRSATLTLQHEVPVFRSSWSIATVAAFVDLGAVELDHMTERFINPGGGMRFYLPKMNFPALGFDVTYSTGDAKTFVTVAVGAGF